MSALDYPIGKDTGNGVRSAFTNAGLRRSPYRMHGRPRATALRTRCRWVADAGGTQERGHHWPAPTRSQHTWASTAPVHHGLSMHSSHMHDDDACSFRNPAVTASERAASARARISFDTHVCQHSTFSVGPRGAPLAARHGKALNVSCNAVLTTILRLHLHGWSRYQNADMCPERHPVRVEYTVCDKQGRPGTTDVHRCRMWQQ